MSERIEKLSFEQYSSKETYEYYCKNIERQNRAIERAKKRTAQEKKEKHERNDLQVKEYLSAIHVFQKAIKEAKDAFSFGKFAPEAKRFTLNKHKKVNEALDEFDELLK